MTSKAPFKRGDIVLCDCEEAPGWYGVAIVASTNDNTVNDVNIIWMVGRTELHFNHGEYDAFVPAAWLTKIGECK